MTSSAAHTLNLVSPELDMDNKLYVVSSAVAVSPRSKLPEYDPPLDVARIGAVLALVELTCTNT